MSCMCVGGGGGGGGEFSSYKAICAITYILSNF